MRARSKSARLDIAQGKPTQEAYVERLNGRLHDEGFNENVFVLLTKARCIIERSASTTIPSGCVAAWIACFLRHMAQYAVTPKSSEADAARAVGSALRWHHRATQVQITTGCYRSSCKIGLG